MLEMPLINCKVEFSLSWDPNCVLSNFSWGFNFYNNWCKTVCSNCYFINKRQCEIIKTLSEGFNRPVYWNKYKITPNKTYNENDYIRELLHASYQGVERLFVLVYRNRGCANRLTADSHRRYFLPKVKIKNYNIEIDKRNLYDEPVNDLIKQHDEVRKVSTGQGDD